MQNIMLFTLSRVCPVQQVRIFVTRVAFLYFSDALEILMIPSATFLAKVKNELTPFLTFTSVISDLPA